MPDLSLGDVGPARRLGRHREVDTVASQRGEDVRLEPVDEPAAQLDLGARQPASEGSAAQPVPGLKESASSADPHVEGCWQNLSGSLLACLMSIIQFVRSNRLASATMPAPRSARSQSSSTIGQ